MLAQFTAHSLYLQHVSHFLGPRTHNSFFKTRLVSHTFWAFKLLVHSCFPNEFTHLTTKKAGGRQKQEEFSNQETSTFKECNLGFFPTLNETANLELWVQKIMQLKLKFWKKNSNPHSRTWQETWHILHICASSYEDAEACTFMKIISFSVTDMPLHSHHCSDVPTLVTNYFGGGGKHSKSKLRGRLTEEHLHSEFWAAFIRNSVIGFYTYLWV